MRGEEESYKKVWNNKYRVKLNGNSKTYKANEIIRDFNFFWEDFEDECDELM